MSNQDLLSGGKADNLTQYDFDPEQLRIGIKHEFEHTNDANIAQEIAMDHLTEDPLYYQKLGKIESRHLMTKLRKIIRESLRSRSSISPAVEKIIGKDILDRVSSNPDMFGAAITPTGNREDRSGHRLEIGLACLVLGLAPMISGWGTEELKKMRSLERLGVLKIVTSNHPDREIPGGIAYADPRKRRDAILLMRLFDELKSHSTVPSPVIHYAIGLLLGYDRKDIKWFVAGAEDFVPADELPPSESGEDPIILSREISLDEIEQWAKNIIKTGVIS